MASHTISSKLQKGRWTPEYCTVIHLLFTNLTYRSMAAQLTHPDGVTDNQIADYYRSRKCAGRSKNFQAIEAAELSDEQLALVEGLMHEAGRVEGLPFVHTADCFRANMPYWYFEPQIVRPYQVGFPPRMWRTRVAFRIKGTRGTYAVKDAMMCDADECPDCMTVA
ncbi:hypothetical protein LTS01_010975 [Friedmanniomyces endolithicus]|nr:hypothetical protein LTS01_010975 [Friedmanniomyces endolithicus]